MDTALAAPVATGDFAADVAAFSDYWRGMPDKQAARDARYVFLRRHARTLYDTLAGSELDANAAGEKASVELEATAEEEAECVARTSARCGACCGARYCRFSVLLLFLQRSAAWKTGCFVPSFNVEEQKCSLSG